jgi:hypothetical protein
MESCGVFKGAVTCWSAVSVIIRGCASDHAVMFCEVPCAALVCAAVCCAVSLCALRTASDAPFVCW